MGDRLQGKVAVVTGAGRSIGQAEALALAKEGARVLVNDVIDVTETVDAIRAAGGAAAGHMQSCTSWQAGAEIVDAALDNFGRVDIVVNNAGINQPNRIDQMTEAEWDAAVDVSLKGYAATIRAAAPHFIKQGSGAIVNTGSTSGLGHMYMANYCAAKEGALGLTRSVAQELGQYGVRCNLVRPINRRTKMTHPLITQSKVDADALGLSITASRHLPFYDDRTLPVGDHVAALVVVLCLPAMAEVTGQDFFIMGDEVGRFEEPQLHGIQFQPGGWTVEALEKPEVIENLLGGVPRWRVRTGADAQP